METISGMTRTATITSILRGFCLVLLLLVLLLNVAPYSVPNQWDSGDSITTSLMSRLFGPDKFKRLPRPPVDECLFGHARKSNPRQG
jgi:hypothetical protein